MTTLPSASAYMEIRTQLFRHATISFDVDRWLDEFEAGIREDERRRIGNSHADPHARIRVCEERGSDLPWKIYVGRSLVLSLDERQMCELLTAPPTNEEADS